MNIPICYKCKKPVDNFTRNEDIQNNEIVCIAECHGSKEIVRLPKELKYEICEIGYAFQVSQEQINLQNGKNRKIQRQARPHNHCHPRFLQRENQD